MQVLYLVFFLVFCYRESEGKKQPKPFTQKRPDSKYDNPSEIRDRERDLEEKAFKKDGGMFRPSVMDDKWVNRFRKPFHPAWMDYCDPYHCNDYHKLACGLNRKQMKFKWFQSGCHIALNNICNVYKGTLKYDMIEAKYCSRYVLQLRSSCPQHCDDYLAPVCGISSYDNHVVVFKNNCFFERANCNKSSFDEYEEAHMDICRNTLAYEKIKKG